MVFNPTVRVPQTINQHLSGSKPPVKQNRKKLNDYSLRQRVSAAERDEVLLSYLEYLGTPRALTSWMLYKYGEHHQLVSLAIDPLGYSDVESFRLDYAATKFFSKTDNLETGIDTRAVALDSAKAAEAKCYQTNQWIRDCVAEGFPPELVDTISRAQATVAQILGPLKSGMFSDQGWSAGRTTSVWGTELDPVSKYMGRLDVTTEALKTAVPVVAASPSWGSAALDADGPCSVIASAFTLRDGNVLTVVPKNAKTDRTICYEPHCNIRLQLMVGSYLKRRLLLKAGLNLSLQSVNRNLSKIASRDGTYATIDLKSASDTIAATVVELLLNQSGDWYELLNTLRSQRTEWPDGSVLLNQKFSSMGNGFTFELETLVFYALARTITSDVTVYGDDIIVPTEHCSEVCSLLERFGFAINTAKSFSSGHFRESCGADMFRGSDVTPVYLRTLPKYRGDLIKLHNAIVAWGSRSVMTSELYAILRQWRQDHPSFVGPLGSGDHHYAVTLDEAMPFIRKSNVGWEGWWYRTHARRAISVKDGDRKSVV